VSKKTVYFQGSYLITEPLSAQITLSDLSGTPMFKLDPVTIMPGDSANFTYPQHGIEIKFS
jgi:hypothetical protein